MARTVYDPNPHLSILDDGQVKRQIAEQARRALEMADRAKELPPQTAEEIEAERFQYESNAYASDNPRYAAARAAAVNFLVVPLEPGGTTPLVDPSEATRDPRRLLAWWAETSDANVGVALGRIGAQDRRWGGLRAA
jgi:Bifunctional DNA primase/polymerase, N-terminal